MTDDELPHVGFEYKECPSCRRISPDPDDIYTQLSVPMPCCGSTGTIRYAWPSVEGIQYLEIINVQSLETKHGRRIATVFLTALCELLLEDVLWLKLNQLTESSALAEATFEGHRGSERRRSLFKRLHRPIPSILAEKELSPFFEAWTELERGRNFYAHGAFSPEPRLKRAFIAQARDTVLPAFVAIHNDVVGPPGGTGSSS